MKKIISFTLDESVVKNLDKYARKMNLSRSQLAQNLINVALQDVSILEFFGFLDLASGLRKMHKHITLNTAKATGASGTQSGRAGAGA